MTRPIVLFDSQVLALGDCGRAEFVMATERRHLPGINTWPDEIRSAMHRAVADWFEAHPDRASYAVTSACPRTAGGYSFVLIVHHVARPECKPCQGGT